MCICGCSSQDDTAQASPDSSPAEDKVTLGSAILSYEDVLGRREQGKSLNSIVNDEINLLDDIAASVTTKYSEGFAIHITMLVPFGQGKDIEARFTEVLEEFDTVYGQSRPARGYATWSTPSARGRLVEVSLTDGSRTYGKPVLIVEWSEYQDRKYVD